MRLRTGLITGVLLCGLFAGGVGAGQQTAPGAMPPAAVLERLSQEPMWHALLHYEESWPGGHASTVDDERFFLAQNGDRSPAAELEATLRAVLPSVPGAEQVRCRFPARYRWLRQRLADRADLPEQACPRLESWYAAINPGSATLVFPAAYLNSPASMYGHTLLRIDPPQAQSGSVLDSWAINFAADTRETNGLVFAVKGLTGMYQGEFSVLPYYEKVNAYSAIENRDLWEYQLHLTPSELRWMLLHAWELNETGIDYYFFDENCSYQLLALLLAARPEAPLLEGFGLYAIPSDTLRQVQEVPGLTGELHFRPSLQTRIRAHQAQLSEAEKTLVLALVEDGLAADAPQLRVRGEASRARILDTAYALMQYRYNRAGGERERHAGRSLELLRARSRIPLGDTQPPVDVPATPPHAGHGSGRFKLGAGRLAGTGFVEIGLRPAYHDLLDPPAGYVRGAQLEMFALRAREYENGNTELEQLRFVDILSVAPRDRFFQPLSWKVHFGLERLSLGSGQRPLLGSLRVGAGPAWTGSGDWYLHVMPAASLLVGNEIGKGMTAGAGLDAGLTWYPAADWSLMLSGSVTEYPGKLEVTRVGWSLDQNLALDRNLGLRLRVGREGVAGAAQRELQLALLWYF